MVVMDTNATPANDTPEKKSPPTGKQEPEKYIRTFAGDMEVLQKGGVPDLVPLQKSAPTEAKEPAVPSPVIPVPPSSPPTPVPPPPPAAGSQPAPVAVKEEPKSVPLKTYEGDFSQQVKVTQASTATILAAEQDSTPQAAQEPGKPSRSNLLYVIAGIVLLVAGGAGAYIAYSRYLAIQAPVEPAPVVSAPIFVDEREQLSGQGPALLLAIEQSLARPLAQNAVRLLYTASSTTIGVFSTSTLPASVPNILLRNVNAAGSMAGIVNRDGSQSPFFILSVSSFGDTFAGMLAWEPFILRDLARLFPPFPEPVITTSVATSTIATTTSKSKTKGTTTATSTTATTTPSIPVAPLTFRDEVIANHDVRIYRDAAGRSILVYGYWNQITLVIARSPAAFTEILERLATSRAQ